MPTNKESVIRNLLWKLAFKGGTFYAVYPSKHPASLIVASKQSKELAISFVNYLNFTGKDPSNFNKPLYKLPKRNELLFYKDNVLTLPPI